MTVAMRSDLAAFGLVAEDDYPTLVPWVGLSGNNVLDEIERH